MITPEEIEERLYQVKGELFQIDREIAKFVYQDVYAQMGEVFKELDNLLRLIIAIRERTQHE